MDSGALERTINSAFERYVEPRLSRIETLLDEQLPSLGVLVRQHDRQIEDLEKSVNSLWKDYRTFKEADIQVKSRCPRDEIDAIRKWIWGVVAGLIIQAIVIFNQ